MEVDRNGLEVLGRTECLALLATVTLGRIGLTSAALPTILPVNFRLVGDDIVVHTAAGTKLDAATRNAVVAFEADAMDPVEHTGWSVVVTGVAREAVDDELAALTRVPLARWAPLGDERVIAIAAQLISGRRITHGLTMPNRQGRDG